MNLDEIRVNLCYPMCSIAFDLFRCARSLSIYSDVLDRFRSIPMCSIAFDLFRCGRSLSIYSDVLDRITIKYGFFQLSMSSINVNTLQTLFMFKM